MLMLTVIKYVVNDHGSYQDALLHCFSSNARLRSYKSNCPGFERIGHTSTTNYGSGFNFGFFKSIKLYFDF